MSRETFHEPVYRAEVEPVAESPDEMEAVLRAQFVEGRFDRRDLSEEERSILRAAQGNSGYSESHPYSVAYRSLLKRLGQRAYLDGNVEKDAPADSTRHEILRYDDEYHEYWLRFVGTEQ
ncbi:hypothetical protein [Halorussus sp. MSC15.2]|uniref:hypothetical protein n=1 Tax=Halorussus sp. MSC15.2 TaxID=2283638 RepID=UPI0019670D25|nr:hypothetical protein [Halorussus sp. MSC15.2]